MQTTQWGPEGWVMFHVLPFYYANKNPRSKQRILFKDFYVILKDILPCIYCRQSYKNFLNEIPIDPYLEGFLPLFEWTYRMHNLVNKKLRDQGYLDEEDPSLELVLENFKELCTPPDSECRRWHLDPKRWLGPTLNFIATIVFNYDEKSIEKVIAYGRFFHIWPKLMIGPEMKALNKIISMNGPDLSSQEALINWYFDVVQELVEHLGKDPRKKKDLIELGIDPSFSNFEDYIEKFEARRAKCKQKSCRVLKADKLKRNLIINNI